MNVLFVVSAYSPLLCFFSCVCAEDFHLSIDGGEFTDSEIIVMLGENGKSVFALFVAK